MVANARQAGNAPYLNVRLAEWSLVAILIIGLVWVFLHQVRVVQRQAELAAVRTTLGALRAAMALQHLRQRVAQTSQSEPALQRNPFEWLQRRPANYAGVMHSAELAGVPPGTWVFEVACGCVGYLPADATEFDSPSGETMAWYSVDDSSGPLQLTAKEAYFWQGQAMN